MSGIESWNSYTDADALFAPFTDGELVWGLPGFAPKWVRLVTGNPFYMLLVLRAARR